MKNKLLAAAFFVLITFNLTVNARAASSQDMCDGAVTALPSLLLQGTPEQYRGRITASRAKKVIRIVQPIATGFNRSIEKATCKADVSVDASGKINREIANGLEAVAGANADMLVMLVQSRLHGEGSARRYVYSVTYTVQPSKGQLYVYVDFPIPLDQLMTAAFLIGEPSAR